MTGSFSLAPTPQLHFGSGKLSVLHSVIRAYGKNVLLITGARSFLTSELGSVFPDQLRAAGFSFEHYIISKEPIPKMIDEAVSRFISFNSDVVVAIGGGSVLDAGKAISAMMPLNEPVKDYLEGVGTKASHPGFKVPFIAIPTTSGTGSEATKNAVISEIGEHGFKRSLRHNNFVPNVAILDPVLTAACPPAITASSGMDAFTQLLESYLSTNANPITDALAVEGLTHISNSLLVAYENGFDINARTGMSLAAYLSGITLANAGLGTVHGFASSVGGLFDIPHGVICSCLMPSCNKISVRLLRKTRSNDLALRKYAIVGKMFSKQSNQSDDYYVDYILTLMEDWTLRMKIPRLRDGGVSTKDFEKIARITDNKNNPVALGHDEIIEALEIAC